MTTPRHSRTVLRMPAMPITITLSGAESAQLRRRAALEHRSEQEVVSSAIASYLDRRERDDLLDDTLRIAVPRCLEALDELERVAA